MKIVHYASAGEAIRKLRKSEVEHLIVDHELVAGEMIPEGMHSSNEWIIMGPGRGKCKVNVSQEAMEVELSLAKATIIFIPAETRHSFEALTNLHYTVLRDGFS